MNCNGKIFLTIIFPFAKVSEFRNIWQIPRKMDSLDFETVQKIHHFFFVSSELVRITKVFCMLGIGDISILVSFLHFFERFCGNNC